MSLASGGSSRTVTRRVSVSDSPAVSVTVTVAVYVPGAVYVWVAVGAVCGPTAGDPSPKSKR